MAQNKTLPEQPEQEKYIPFLLPEIIETATIIALAVLTEHSKLFAMLDELDAETQSSLLEALVKNTKTEVPLKDWQQSEIADLHFYLNEYWLSGKAEIIKGNAPATTPTSPTNLGNNPDNIN